ncbi:MAG: DUF1588 domain-containing protein [Bdellovibrionaceae bacterium]|nr:DUF1588 domain-containing protein [Pseudobdellovibrionaceae bacterium]
MGLSASFKFLSVASGCVACAVLFNNCSPSFQVPSAESLGLSQSLGALCTGGLNLTSKANARLTAREFSHSLKDLYGGFVSASVIEGALASLPRESLSLAHTRLDFDSTISRSVQFNEVEAYGAISETVANAFAAKLKDFPDAGALTAMLGGNCFVTEARPGDVCLRKSYGALAYRMYRRPPTVDEVERLLAIHKDSLNADKYEAISLVAQYLMQSPDFLYKVEGPFDGSGQVYALNDFEIATRLAYGIIGGPPPNWLLTSAANGELVKEESRGQIIERLFAMPEAERTTRDFYDQWLRTSQIPKVSEVGLGTSGLNPDRLRDSAIAEIRAYTRHITWGTSGSYRDLMTSNLLVPNSAELAQVYGVTRSSTPVAGPAERRGLMTRAGMLMVKADGRTGPIVRGARLRSDMLCDELMAPPDSVFSNLGSFSPLDSTRKQTEDITRAPSCMGCHSQINSLGFAFESYSGLGGQRTTEVVSSEGQSRTHGVQTSGSAYVDRAPVNFNDSQDLVERIVSGHQGPLCMAKRYYQFTSGLGKTSAQGCEFEEMAKVLASSDGSILDMMKSYYARREILYRLPGEL